MKPRPPKQIGGSHYETLTPEPIEVIEAWEHRLGYHLCTALKYIARAGQKEDAVKDLEKSIWYIKRKIELLTEE